MGYDTEFFSFFFFWKRKMFRNFFEFFFVLEILCHTKWRAGTWYDNNSGHWRPFHVTQPTFPKTFSISQNWDRVNEWYLGIWQAIMWVSEVVCFLACHNSNMNVLGKNLWRTTLISKCNDNWGKLRKSRESPYFHIYMQFLVARSLCTNLIAPRYIMPCPTCIPNLNNSNTVISCKQSTDRVTFISILRYQS